MAKIFLKTGKEVGICEGKVEGKLGLMRRGCINKS